MNILKFRIADNVYTELNNDKKFKKALRRIAKKRPVPDFFVITEPLYEAGIMEIYNYNELLQPFYRKQKRVINILGIASNRDNAKNVVRDIVEDLYNNNSYDVNTFFGLGG